MIHASYRYLENFISDQYQSLVIKHLADDTFTMGEGERKLTVKYEIGDVIAFRTDTGTPNGYFTIKSNPDGPKLFLKNSGEGMYPDQAAEYLAKLVTD